MGLISRLLDERQKQKGFFAAIGGERLAGKSTIAGTLPGKTLLVQPAAIEAGNLSPKVLAESLGNTLDIVELARYQDFFELLSDEEILAYDNLYIDGISAVTEQIYRSPEYVAKTADGNVFKGFALIHDVVDDLIGALKNFSAKHDKNVFVTFATESLRGPGGAVNEVKVIAKGKFPSKFVEKAAGNVLQVVLHQDEDGSTKRVLVVGTTGPYHARIGDILEGQLPKAMSPNLGELLTQLNRS